MANPSTPVVGDIVHYFKVVVPHTGPAIGGDLQAHAALVIGVRDDGTLDLKVTDREGSTYLMRRVMQTVVTGPRADRWDWRRP